MMMLFLSETMATSTVASPALKMKMAPVRHGVAVDVEEST